MIRYAIAGCLLGGALGACTTPYQRMGYSGGYDDKRLGNGDYIVTVRVNGYTDRATALEYLHRRAGELCPEGFDFVDRSGGDNGGIVATRNFVGENHKPEEDAVIRCKAAPVASSEEDEDEPTRHSKKKRKVVLGDRPLYCAALVSDSNAGPCFLDESVCNDTQANHPDTYTSCVKTNAAACFNARRTLDEAHVSFCSVSVSGCEAERSNYESNPDFTRVLAQCEVYRVGAN